MKAVLFDLDGTLLDRKASLIDFVRWQAEGMLKSELIDVDSFVQRFLKLDDSGMVWKDKVYQQLISEFTIKKWSVDDLLTSYQLCFCAFSKPLAGAVEAVKSLKKSGYKLALVSNGKTPLQERNFNALGIADLFDTIIISEAVGFKKPDKAIFELTCKHLGIATSSAVFVGDSIKADIDGANNAGMFSVFIPSDHNQVCPQADAICADYSELPSIILNAKTV